MSAVRNRLQALAEEAAAEMPVPTPAASQGPRRDPAELLLAAVMFCLRIVSVAVVATAYLTPLVGIVGTFALLWAIKDSVTPPQLIAVAIYGIFMVATIWLARPRRAPHAAPSASAAPQPAPAKPPAPLHSTSDEPPPLTPMPEDVSEMLTRLHKAEARERAVEDAEYESRRLPHRKARSETWT